MRSVMPRHGQLEHQVLGGKDVEILGRGRGGPITTSCKQYRQESKADSKFHYSGVKLTGTRQHSSRGTRKIKRAGKKPVQA